MLITGDRALMQNLAHSEVIVLNDVPISANKILVIVTVIRALDGPSYRNRPKNIGIKERKTKIEAKAYPTEAAGHTYKSAAMVAQHAIRKEKV